MREKSSCKNKVYTNKYFHGSVFLTRKMLYLLIIICVIILACIYRAFSRYRGSGEIGTHIKFDPGKENIPGFLNFRPTEKLHREMAVLLDRYKNYNNMNNVNIKHNKKVMGDVNNAIKKYNILMQNREIIHVKETNKGAIEKVVSEMEKIRLEMYPQFKIVDVMLNEPLNLGEELKSITEDNVNEYDIFTGHTLLTYIVTRGTFLLSKSYLKARALRRLACDEIEKDKIPRFLEDLNYFIEDDITEENWISEFEKSEKKHPYERDKEDAKKFSMARIINYIASLKEISYDLPQLGLSCTPLDLAISKQEPIEFIKFLHYQQFKSSIDTPTNINSIDNEKIKQSYPGNVTRFCKDYYQIAGIDSNYDKNSSKINEFTNETLLVHEEIPEFIIKMID